MAEESVVARARTRDLRLIGGGLVVEDKPNALLVWMTTRLQEVATGPASKCLRREAEADLEVLACGRRKENWLVMRNGLRCHFEIKLKSESGGWRVVAYSFQVDAPADVGALPPYMRYDLTREPHLDPVKEPWCHFTPGNDDIRAPAAPLTPKELVAWCMNLEPWW